MANKLQHAWDGYDAYLFDIDGTLLQCRDAVHYFAFCDALSAVAGRPMNLDGVVAHGNTDAGILRDAMTLGGVAESVWRPRMVEMRDAMCAQVQRNKAELQAEALPGAAEVLQHLHARGATLGVATGNFAGIGTLKLEHCGLRQFFDFEGYSDGWETRSDVFAAALAMAHSLKGASASVCVVGDTPADVRAAQANGLDVIAVATGVYPRQQLEAEQPTRCIPSFSELLSGTAGLLPT